MNMRTLNARCSSQIRVDLEAQSGRIWRTAPVIVEKFQLLGGQGCGASSLAYIWMRSFRGSYSGRSDTAAG
jgi:hypothetical protein